MDTGIHVLIQEIVIHVTTHNINVYILITKYQSRYFNYIKMFYYIHVTNCILIHSEYFFVWLACYCITIRTYSTYSTYFIKCINFKNSFNISITIYTHLIFHQN